MPRVLHVAAGGARSTRDARAARSVSAATPSDTGAVPAMASVPRSRSSPARSVQLVTVDDDAVLLGALAPLEPLADIRAPSPKRCATAVRRSARRRVDTRAAGDDRRRTAYAAVPGRREDPTARRARRRARRARAAGHRAREADGVRGRRPRAPAGRARSSALLRRAGPRVPRQSRRSRRRGRQGCASSPAEGEPDARGGAALLDTDLVDHADGGGDHRPWRRGRPAGRLLRRGDCRRGGGNVVAAAIGLARGALAAAVEWALGDADRGDRRLARARPPAPDGRIRGYPWSRRRARRDRALTGPTVAAEHAAGRCPPTLAAATRAGG